LFDRTAPLGIITAEAHPLRVLEQFEKRRTAMARRGLVVATADMIEAVQDFSSAQVREVDAELEKIGAYTLTFLRSQLTRRGRKGL
jgi:hypothetical protein